MSQKAGLDPDRMVEAALALVESEGPDALTMRRLAADLGVATTTIYWHVGGRDEVVAALIERLSVRLGGRAPRGSDPIERIESVAVLVWESAFAHRHVTALAHQCGLTSLLELPLELTLARELEAAGLRGTEARDALRSILMCVAGFLVVALRPPESVPAAQRSQALWADVVDADIDPTTVEALAGPVDVEALFRRTLRVVIASFVPDAIPT